MNISIVIPTFGREEVLVKTIEHLLTLDSKADEIIIVDQNVSHQPNTIKHLTQWNAGGNIRWIRILYPSITRAMNIGLRLAKGERIIFLDDDIIPTKDLIDVYRRLAETYPQSIIAGRVLQPWHHGKPDDEDSPFLFNSLVRKEVNSFIGCNFSVPRKLAVETGGFDTNFVKVAYKFEAEFANRWIMNGYRIIYEPTALIEHLKSPAGGTRTWGLHLTTVKPDHAVGRYYFNLCTRSKSSALVRSIHDIFRSILTRHHLSRPYWIPITIIAELRGLLWSMVLFSSGRGLIKDDNINLLIIASHPVQYTSQIFQALSNRIGLSSQVLYLTIPDSKSQSLGFKKDFLWDIPLLDGYRYLCAEKSIGKGLGRGFRGVQVANPIKELKRAYTPYKPDIVLLTGWHFWGMVQMFLSLIIGNIPIVLRMDSNSLKKRNRVHNWIYRHFFRFVNICLTVGRENERFCLDFGMNPNQIVRCPHIVDNNFFCSRTQLAKNDREVHRSTWKIPFNSFCFLFAGKLQQKKNPLDLLKAFEQAFLENGSNIHLLIVGSGELEEECKHFVSSRSIPVTFTGFLNQTEIPKAYAVSDCIVLPSNDDETWGLVINEAMACGLPAIVSDQVGCTIDLIQDYVTGFKYRCGDIEELKKSLTWMAINRELAERMGQNAKNLIFSKYNLKHVIDGIEDAITLIHGGLKGR